MINISCKKYLFTMRERKFFNFTGADSFGIFGSRRTGIDAIRAINQLISITNGAKCLD